MKYWIQIILLALLVSSCDYFKAPREPKAIARVGKSYLYESDILNLVPKGTSKEDSIAIVKSFIDRWATQKLLFEAAEKNIFRDILFNLNLAVSIGRHPTHHIFRESGVDQFNFAVALRGVLKTQHPVP